MALNGTLKLGGFREREGRFKLDVFAKNVTSVMKFYDWNVFKLFH